MTEATGAGKKCSTFDLTKQQDCILNWFFLFYSINEKLSSKGNTEMCKPGQTLPPIVMNDCTQFNNCSGMFVEKKLIFDWF